MCNNEFKSQFDSLLSRQKYIPRQLRAQIIDWLFEVGSKMNIEDRTVIYQAINLMDRYYEALPHSQPSNDLQLTAVTSLFIASKNLEVDPLDLKTCTRHLCYHKYSKADFLRREAQIRLAINYEVEAPTGLDFIMLYVRMIKMEFQQVTDCLTSTSQFFFDVNTIAYDFFKSLIIDASMLKYRPSVIAAACICLGFQLQFDLQMKGKRSRLELDSQ